MFKISNKFLVLLLLFFFSGCAGHKFIPVELVPLNVIDPVKVLEYSSVKVPSEFVLLNSIVFSYYGRKMSALGYTKINRANESFSVAALNPVGIKLFELSYAEGKLVTHYVMDELLKHGNASGAIGEDVAKIYFNLAPIDNFAIKQKKKTFEVKQPLGSGYIKYVYGGIDSVLIEKSFYKNDKRQWQVKYYDYKKVNGKLLSFGIILKHDIYKYKLYIKTKEVIG